MNTYIKCILCLALLPWVFMGCENEAFVWGEQSYARIVGPEVWTNETDSMTFTFSTYAEDVTEFAVETEIVVQGTIADYDRIVRLQVNEEKTTAPAATYSFPTEVVLKAGEHQADFNIMLYRTEAMKESDMRLCVEVAPTGDLLAGVSNYSSLTMVWNDKITRPINWDDLEEFFGEYSETKYRFIITTLGISLFPYGDGMTWGQMNDYQLRLAAALDAYNADPNNPDTPLKDEETGDIISF